MTDVQPPDLTRATMTRAARIMLPTYPLFCLWTGVSYIVLPENRISDSPALSFFNAGVPLYFLGIFVLLIGALQILALGIGRRWLMQVGLSALFGIMTTLAIVYIGAATMGGAPFSAAAYPSLVAVAAWASLMSINDREVQP